MPHAGTLRERERGYNSVRFLTLATKTILVNNTATASVIFFFVRLWDIDNKSVTNNRNLDQKRTEKDICRNNYNQKEKFTLKTAHHEHAR